MSTHRRRTTDWPAADAAARAGAAEGAGDRLHRGAGRGRLDLSRADRWRTELRRGLLRRCAAPTSAGGRDRPAPAGADVCDVVRDGARHDAADRRPDDHDLCGDRRDGGGEGRAGGVAAGADRRLCRWCGSALRSLLAALQGRLARLGAARRRDGVGKPAVLRRDIHRRRRSTSSPR